MAAGRTGAKTARRGFTLFELVLTTLVLAILAGLAFTYTDLRTDRARAAAERLIADIDYARSEAIARPDVGCVLRFAASPQSYWLARRATPTTPISHPLTKGEYRVVFGSDAQPELKDVRIASMSLGGDGVIEFDALGAPDQSTAATVTVACGRNGYVVTIEPNTGIATLAETTTSQSGGTLVLGAAR